MANLQLSRAANNGHTKDKEPFVELKFFTNPFTFDTWKLPYMDCTLTYKEILTYFDYVMKSRFCVPHLFMCVSGVTGSITHACLLFKYIVYYFDSGRVQQEIKIEYALVSTTCLTRHYASQVPLCRYSTWMV